MATIIGFNSMNRESEGLHFFHYHCEKLGRDIQVEDWLIPDAELEGARRLEGTSINCKRCGKQHALFIRRKSDFR